VSRVLLVSSNRERRPYPVPPLGLCLLAERLCERHEVLVFDGMFAEADDLRAAIDAFSPDVVGLGVRNVDDMMTESPRVYVEDIADRFVAPIRESTRAPLVLGGSGYSLFPRALLERFGADYGVVGEAEHALPALLEAIEAGRGGAAVEIPGVVVAGRGHGSVCPGRRCEPSEIGPSRIDRWVDFEPYRERGTYPVQTKRGCACECLYCTYPRLEGCAPRRRAPAAIVDEIEGARDRLGGDVTFELVDSAFDLPPGHAEAVCEELIRRRSQVRLRAMGLAPGGLKTGLAAQLRAAGFRQIDCTPDSAAPAVIEGLRKGFTLEDLRTAARSLRDAGLPTMWFMLFGGPGESEETFAQTIDFIDRYVDPADMVLMAMGLRIYPGTPLHEVALRAGEVGADDDLRAPRFYVSAALGRDRCRKLILEACAVRPNCVPAWESGVDASMIERARELRKAQDDEPLFRTMIRLRRETMETMARDGARRGGRR
jgi:radical SAM superfamily enzyme YgiQ (UPF0313 family)